MLEIIDATLGFGGRRLFEPISLKIPRGEVMLLTAPSGAGKSTLLHWICGTSPEELEAKGEISLDGKVLTGLKAEERNIGIIFQDGLLFPHLSVWENLAFGMKGGGSKSTRRQKVESALAEIGLAGLGGRDPLTLSGGQKARVALLRSLLAEPQALLLDEPFSGLDGATRNDFADLVLGRIRANNLPAILVSHDPRDEAFSTIPAMRLQNPQ